MWVYNNLFVGCVGPVFGTDGDYNGSLPCTFNDIVIANNVCDYSDAGSNPIALNNITSFSTTFTACVVANNTVIYGSGIDTQGNTTSTLIDNAVVSRTQAASYFAKYSAGTTNSDFHLLAAAASLIGHGANESAYFTTDKDGKARPATGAWDIGAYQYGTNSVPTPILQVTPGSIAYGTILSGTSATNSFTVQNVGTGTLSGTASVVGAPFSILLGGNYSLGANQSQTVKVVFSPGAASNYTQSVTFTGGSGTNVTVTGTATNAPVLPPLIQVTPGNIAYGTILSGTSATNSITVQNVGTGTLSGTASVAGAPFRIVSGGNYILGANQSQTVMVAFSPTVASNYSQSVTFTGGGGTNTTVTGSVPAALPGVQFRITPAKQFILTVAGQTGHRYDIQATQDFKTWTVIGTVTMGAGGSLDFTDTNAAGFSKRFYRTRE